MKLKGVNDFILHYRYGRKQSPLFCVDGFQIGIGAAENFKCKPQENNAPKYEQVQIITWKPCPDLIEYAENENSVIYNFVPVTVVDKLIEKHYGIDIEQCNRAAQFAYSGYISHEDEERIKEQQQYRRYYASMEELTLDNLMEKPKSLKARLLNKLPQTTTIYNCSQYTKINKDF